jgi:hypothetical protein
MSLSEIEAELERLAPDELRDLAMKSYQAFLAKEAECSPPNECDESDPRLLAALDDATARADMKRGEGCSAQDVRAQLAAWISK